MLYSFLSDTTHCTKVTSKSESVSLVFDEIAHASFLSDTTHCRMGLSKSLRRTTVSDDEPGLYLSKDGWLVFPSHRSVAVDWALTVKK